MNRWKISFFILAGLIIAAIVSLVVFISSTGESDPLPKNVKTIEEGHRLTLQATKEDVEGLANQYIKKAIQKEPIPLTVEIANDIILSSELTVFSITLPVRMHFDPLIEPNGNIILQQSSVEIGQLNLPPSTVLKLLRDSVTLPEWMLVRPKEEEVYIDLSELSIPGKIRVQAKEFDVKNDRILLDIFVP